MADVVECKSDNCRAPIIFALAGEHVAPFDAETTEKGRWRIDEALFGTPVARYVPGSSGLYQSHFISCPDAPSWRKTEAQR